MFIEFLAKILTWLEFFFETFYQRFSKWKWKFMEIVPNLHLCARIFTFSQLWGHIPTPRWRILSHCVNKTNTNCSSSNNSWINKTQRVATTILPVDWIKAELTSVFVNTVKQVCTRPSHSSGTESGERQREGRKWGSGMLLSSVLRDCCLADLSADLSEPGLDWPYEKGSEIMNKWGGPLAMGTHCS